MLTQHYCWNHIHQLRIQTLRFMHHQHQSRINWYNDSIGLEVRWINYLYKLKCWYSIIIEIRKVNYLYKQQKLTQHYQDNNQATTYAKSDVGSSLALTSAPVDITTALAFKSDKSTTYTQSDVDTALLLQSDISITFTTSEVAASLD